MMRAEILNRLGGVAASRDAVLVGAAIGTGIMAQAAERGGADFLLALNAGRLRVMGAPSLSSMLPLRPSNAFVADFARNEILTQSTLPVLFGVNAMDPDLHLDRFLDDLADWGFAGVANFPTCIHYPPEVRDALARAKIGFARELSLVDGARQRDLIACIYVRTREQALLAADAGADLICLNVGWNAGGAKGATAPMSIDGVKVMAHEIAGRIARRNPEAICLLEGGPIVNAAQLAEVSQETRIAGYVGGSTLDRLPLEDSVADRTQAFKLASMLGQRQRQDDDDIRRFGREIGLVGASEPLMLALREIRRASRSSAPVLICGEPGSGRSLAADAIHGTRRAVRIAMVSARDLSEMDLAVQLFGRDDELDRGARRRDPGLIELQSDSSIFLENLEVLSRRLQNRLARFLDRGYVTPVRGRRVIKSNARLICSSDRSCRELVDSGLMIPELAKYFAGSEIVVPSLRECLQDFGDVLEHFLTARAGPPQGRRFTITPQGVHALLKYDWPGNRKEFDSFIVRLVDGGFEGAIDADLVRQLLGVSHNATRRENEDERAAILNALSRHRFRRGESAAYLGLSRKTLYNKMRKYGLLG